MRSASRWSFFALVLPLVGCSSSTDSEGVGVPVPIERYCDEYVQVTCAAAERCGCLEGYSFDMCASWQRAECADEVEEPASSGRYEYNASNAGRCLQQLRAILADCSFEGDDEPEACDEVVEGQITEGQPCEDGSECIGALACVDDTCRQLPGDGLPCLDGQCAEGHVCYEGTCRRYRGVGGECASSGAICDEDLYCDPRTNTCQPYLTLGQGCDHATWACGEDLRCAEGTCGPYPGPGQSCMSSGCAEGAYCDEGTCRAEKPEGATCESDEECGSGDCEGGVCEADSDICPF